MTQTITTGARKLSHVTAIVSDLDKALDFYTNVLGMEVRDDQDFEMGDMKMRWLTVACPGQDTKIALQLPMAGPGTKGDPNDWVGNGTMWVLEVDDCKASVDAMREKGVSIAAEPEELPWGISALIRDPDGNPLNLVQPRTS